MQSEDLTDQVQGPANNHIAIRARELPGSHERRGCGRDRLAA